MRAADMPATRPRRDSYRSIRPYLICFGSCFKRNPKSAGRRAKLIAPASDLDGIGAGLRDVHALKGWRAKCPGRCAAFVQSEIA